MNEKPTQEPNWQDISIEDIDAAERNGAPRQALSFARYRLRAIETAPQEIAEVIKQSDTVSKGEWQPEQDALEHEITQLRDIIARLENDVAGGD